MRPPAKQLLKMRLEQGIYRLRTVQNKKSAVSKQQRREMAQLLEKGKETTARIRVENIIRDDNTVELLEIVEQYCEIIKVRLALLDNPGTWDAGLAEAIRVVVHVAETFKSEVKELGDIQSILDGPNRLRIKMDEVEIPERILKKLSIQPPPAELVDLYLQEIARTYGVAWGQPPKTGDSDDDQPSGGIGEALPVFVETENQPGVVASSPIRVQPPHPTTDNPAPRIKLVPHTKVAKPAPKPAPEPKAPGDIDPDDLEARFAALQKW